jgi:hypothetical protein
MEIERLRVQTTSNLVRALSIFGLLTICNGTCRDSGNNRVEKTYNLMSQSRLWSGYCLCLIREEWNFAL